MTTRLQGTGKPLTIILYHTCRMEVVLQNPKKKGTKIFFLQMITFLGNCLFFRKSTMCEYDPEFVIGIKRTKSQFIQFFCKLSFLGPGILVP
jgi:hypothetical protein